MRTHLRIGRLLGVPIGINWGALVICVLLAVGLAQVALPTATPRHPTSAYWFAAVVGVIGFLASLVVHELGHSYVARRNGLHVVEITLWLLGGVAKLDGSSEDPGTEFRVALAGPAMSGVCAVVAGLAAWGIDGLDGSRLLENVLRLLVAVNVVLAVSNLIPAVPLDGGRMLHAVLWRRSGRRRAAGRVAAVVGQVLAAATLLGGAALMIWGSAWAGIWTMATGVFLLVAARSEWLASAPRPDVLTHSVGGYGRRLPRPLLPTSTVAELERVLEHHPAAVLVPVVDERGQVSAMVTRDALARIPPAQRPVVPVGSLSQPVWGLPRVAPEETVQSVVARLGRGRSWWALVGDGHGPESVLCSDDVDQLLELAQA